jgi:hypothetical protein
VFTHVQKWRSEGQRRNVIRCVNGTQVKVMKEERGGGSKCNKYNYFLATAIKVRRFDSPIFIVNRLQAGQYSLSSAPCL